MSQLQNLSKLTTIVADTGDFQSIAKYQPTDATTNPSLLLKAVQSNKYGELVDEAVSYAKKQGGSAKKQLENAMDKLAVNFGLQILKIIKGRVSTEIDARLSFDTNATVEKARHIIKLYENEGIAKERILIKIASTWEGIQACKVLEAEGIHCNMTLMFALEQAIACANANATLISPFVGRILDFFKAKEGKDFASEEDPGVLSVSTIYNYYKKHNVKTTIMGASFRNKGEILELAGIDLLTISPQLLDELTNTQGEVPAKLTVEAAKSQDIDAIEMTESRFRWGMNENDMATDKLADGIRRFAQDTVQLEQTVSGKLNE
mmetsp:Transcript_3978/g.15021  ORF Transcript_3978/g.15021 Transcript_3978/m.15021 type:complete len:320 (+) Transcript_3978:66-1025(+)